MMISLRFVPAIPFSLIGKQRNNGLGSVAHPFAYDPLKSSCSEKQVPKVIQTEKKFTYHTGTSETPVKTLMSPIIVATTVVAQVRRAH